MCRSGLAKEGIAEMDESGLYMKVEDDFVGVADQGRSASVRTWQPCIRREDCPQ